VQRQRLIPPYVWRGRAALFAVFAEKIGVPRTCGIPRGSDSS